MALAKISVLVGEQVGADEPEAVEEQPDDDRTPEGEPDLQAPRGEAL